MVDEWTSVAIVASLDEAGVIGESTDVAAVVEWSVTDGAAEAAAEVEWSVTKVAEEVTLLTGAVVESECLQQILHQK